MENKKVLIISGATATGKTDISINLAKKYPQASFEVVNYDSLLFYNELNIGTAKPTKEELSQIPHHLINISSITNEINASDYVFKCKEIIDKLHKENKTPILTGGSTFYLRSYIKGMYESVNLDEKLKHENLKTLEKNGINYFWEFLEKNDPQSTQTLHINDHYRVIRAYEYFLATGTPISKQKSLLDKNLPYDFSINQHQEINFEHINLLPSKEEHWKIIKERTLKMLKNGLIEETAEILKQYDKTLKPLQSIGYKEVISYLDGDIKNQEDLIELIYINTRKLAKAQKTFLKKVTPKKVINPLSEKDMVYQTIENFIK